MDLLEILKNAESIYDLKLINNKISELLTQSIDKKMSLRAEKEKKIKDLSREKNRVLEYLPFRDEAQALRTSVILLEKQISETKNKRINIFNKKAISQEIFDLENKLDKTKAKLSKLGRKAREEKASDDEKISPIELNINLNQKELDLLDKDICYLKDKKAETDSNAKIADKAFYDYLLSTGIYKSYHSYEAICQFIQYIESGRCSELTGPYGCYNLYETELRAGLVISNLVEINKRLSEIQQTMIEIKSRLEFIGLVSVFMLKELESIDNQLGSIVMNTSAIAMCSAISSKTCSNINEQASEIKSIVEKLSDKK